jgi:hypothetical protein
LTGTSRFDLVAAMLVNSQLDVSAKPGREGQHSSRNCSAGGAGFSGLSPGRSAS